ncbi:hypothetical protein A2U01_0027843, partial [Trifolium medium]|nr:hypothetical protein [Trifolium medium]
FTMLDKHFAVTPESKIEGLSTPVTHCCRYRPPAAMGKKSHKRVTVCSDRAPALCCADVDQVGDSGLEKAPVNGTTRKDGLWRNCGKKG